jgi:predicted RNA binding protein YcfA (HicA-like mRNA interferase family)
MDPAALLRRCARGQVSNIRFRDLRRLVEALGFDLVRVSGSHHIYAHRGVPELVNLQEVGGDAKPYQVRQLMRLVERYALNLEREA